MLGEHITKEVLFAVNNQQILAQWNDTSMVLISKVDSPELIFIIGPLVCAMYYIILSKNVSIKIEGYPARDHFAHSECLCAK